jgi:hypothetical protein
MEITDVQVRHAGDDLRTGKDASSSTAVECLAGYVRGEPRTTRIRTVWVAEASSIPNSSWLAEEAGYLLGFESARADGEHRCRVRVPEAAATAAARRSYGGTHGELDRNPLRTVARASVMRTWGTEDGRRGRQVAPATGARFVPRDPRAAGVRGCAPSIRAGTRSWGEASRYSVASPRHWRRRLPARPSAFVLATYREPTLNACVPRLTIIGEGNGRASTEGSPRDCWSSARTTSPSAASPSPIPA